MCTGPVTVCSVNAQHHMEVSDEDRDVGREWLSWSYFLHLVCVCLGWQCGSQYVSQLIFTVTLTGFKVPRRYLWVCLCGYFQKASCHRLESLIELKIESVTR